MANDPTWSQARPGLNPLAILAGNRGKTTKNPQLLKVNPLTV
ncbi:hypothetical protein NXS08_01525 [Gleimia sp. 6138-11-ORH1]|nr:hypothetical protein [Gleimia sp. 6138-11-ORH1]MCS4484172.1 hypothetical protein [Gleimia sp. 6138-11-ORH1]